MFSSEHTNTTTMSNPHRTTSQLSIDRIVRLPEVLYIVGLTKTTVYKYMQDGQFPSSLKLGSRAVGWRESEIQAWISRTDITQI